MVGCAGKSRCADYKRFRALKDRSLRQLLQGECKSRVGAAEGCDLLIFAQLCFIPRHLMDRSTIALAISSKCQTENTNARSAPLS